MMTLKIRLLLAVVAPKLNMNVVSFSKISIHIFLYSIFILFNYLLISIISLDTSIATYFLLIVIPCLSNSAWLYLSTRNQDCSTPKDRSVVH